jgi:hypothetical protein
MIKNAYRSSYKVPLLLCDFNETLICSADFRKNPQISIFRKIRSLGAELFHVDVRTDMTKLTVVFRNFADVPNKY